MLDQRKPFDVSSLLQEVAETVHATEPSRATYVTKTPLPRAAFKPHSADDGAGSANSPTSEESPWEANTGEARPDLLVAREQTHGSFADNARVSQALKDIFRAEPGWGLLTSVERESMDMIALKFSRILSGKSLELQHWEDVVGYAKLAEEICK